MVYKILHTKDVGHLKREGRVRERRNPQEEDKNQSMSTLIGWVPEFQSFLVV